MAEGWTYRDAGVDLEAGNRAVRLMRRHVAAARRPEVLADIGAFAGAFALPKGCREPVLVAGADGVGTKLKVAFAADRHDTVGIDCVAMCVNDVLTAGAEPLFFLDYLAFGRLDAEKAARVVAGVAEGCRRAGCALLGGETAEMPGFYGPGEYDLAGFAVGVVERSRLLDGAAVRDGDVLVGLASSGLHANGYSLVRRVLLEEGRLSLDAVPTGLARPLGEELLEPTRIYVRPILSLLASVPVRAMVHVTGGGLVENLPRVLPPGLEARLRVGSWPEPPIFDLVRRLGRVDEGEMRRTFNLGVGFVCVVPAEAADRAIAHLAAQGEQAFLVGEVAPGERGVVFD
ncbi:MAG: phosphoribosylformylglycinamidine cyclo-ligase [Clostridia bacterium]|nr:phosphoribosylformylglycinamidine cyclo-ligase [Clostridia bacterium]